MAGSKRNKAESGKPRDTIRRAPLSLYPLDFSTALGAALKTGKAPDPKGKKTTGKKQGKSKAR